MQEITSLRRGSARRPAPRLAVRARQSAAERRGRELELRSEGLGRAEFSQVGRKMGASGKPSWRTQMPAGPGQALEVLMIANIC